MTLDSISDAEVFSACAEVVPAYSADEVKALRILRVRGGSSQIPAPGAWVMVYSPRARR